MHHCSILRQRIEASATGFDEKSLLLHYALLSTIDTPDHPYWLRKVREEAWLQEIDLATLLHEAMRKVLRRPNRDAGTWTGEHPSVVLRRRAMEKGDWPPSDYDPMSWWYGREGSTRRLSQGPDRAEWPQVASSLRCQVQARRTQH